MAVTFFVPDSPFGDFADWKLNTGGNPNTTEQRAQALGPDGDEIAWKGYGKKTALTATYVATKAVGDLVIPKAGQVVGGCHIDSVQVAYNQTGYPIMTLSGHRHDHGNPHTTCRTYTGSVTLPAAAIGIPAAFGDVFKLQPSAEVGMRGATYTLSVIHVDEMDGVGGQLAGENRDGTEELAIELTADAAPTDYAVSAAWHLGTLAKALGNTVATTSSLNLTHHIAHD